MCGRLMLRDSEVIHHVTTAFKNLLSARIHSQYADNINVVLSMAVLNEHLLEIRR